MLAVSESVSIMVKCSYLWLFASPQSPICLPFLVLRPFQEKELSQCQNLWGTISLRPGSLCMFWMGVVLACRWVMIQPCVSGGVKTLQGHSVFLSKCNESGYLWVGLGNLYTFNKIPQAILFCLVKFDKYWTRGLTEVTGGHFRGRTTSKHVALAMTSLLLGHAAWQVTFMKLYT